MKNKTERDFKKEMKPAQFLTVSAFSILGVLFSCGPKPAGVLGAKTITAEHLAQGKTIYYNSCGKCHDLPSPSEHSAQDWVGIMNSMAPKAKLNDMQHQIVYDYIVSAKN